MAKAGTRPAGEQPNLRAEWSRVRRAALFFFACVLLVFVLAAVGIYH